MSQHVLLLGGHGKIAQLMTPILLSHGYTVTSVIRDQAQTATITKLGEGKPGKLSVLVRSLEDIKSEQDARSVVDEVKPTWVIFSAGAGQNGGPDGSRHFAVDRDAAKHFSGAAVHTPTVTAFLLISYNSSRRNKPSWWSDADWAYATKLNTEILRPYAEAKIAADEYFAALAHKRGAGFRAISLRPGWLTAEPAGGVELGKPSKSDGKVSREAVAKTAVAVLESGYKGGWLDMLDGEEEIQAAVERVVREGIDTFEGEDAERIYKLAD
ncbi:NAD(P)-binding protein [Daedaleopsis nitida]|nr:NAD(P)-binding protein [Daedaleopsis nitida]